MNYRKISGLVLFAIGIIFILLSIFSMKKGISPLSKRREPVPNSLVGDLVGRPLNQTGVMVHNNPFSQLAIGVIVTVVGGLLFVYRRKGTKT